MVIPEDIEELIVCKLAGEISPDGEKRIKEWLEAEEGHRQVYAQYCTIWYGGMIGNRRYTRKQDEWAAILDKHRQRKQRYLMLWLVSGAACCLLFIGSYLWFFNRSPQEEFLQARTVSELIEKREVEKVKLILSTGREVALDGVITEQEGGASIYSDSTGLKYSSSDMVTAKEMVYNELIVPKCGEYRLKLADGTTIMVNSESVVRYPVNFTENVREVWLSGEAFFDVARNDNQPFIVHLDHATVKVLGTSFNIMAYQDEINTEITLVHGTVEVGTSERRELLLPGNQIQVENTTLSMKSRKVDVYQYIAWKDGVLRFDDMPLGQLMTRLSRWYDIAFEFKREELKGHLFSGGFKKYEQLEHILKMIQEINDVKFCVVNSKVIIDKK